MNEGYLPVENATPPQEGLTFQAKTHAAPTPIWLLAGGGFLAVVLVVVSTVLFARWQQGRARVQAPAPNTQLSQEAPQSEDGQLSQYRTAEELAAQGIELREVYTPFYLENTKQSLNELESWENPLRENSTPCFVSGEKTCQFAIHRGSGAANAITIFSYALPKKQETQDLFFLFGRMLTVSSSILDYAKGGLVMREVHPEITKAIYDAGLKHGINPAFLFSVYDRLYLAGEEHGWPPIETLQRFSPDTLASEFAAALQNPGSLDGTELGRALRQKSWTPEAQALAFVLSSHVHPEILARFFANPGELEDTYYQYFAPELLKGNLTLSFQAEGNPAPYEQPVGEAIADYAVCQNGSAYLCEQDGQSASCTAFPLFNQFCYELVNVQ